MTFEHYRTLRIMLEASPPMAILIFKRSSSFCTLADYDWKTVVAEVVDGKLVITIKADVWTMTTDIDGAHKIRLPLTEHHNLFLRILHTFASRPPTKNQLITVTETAMLLHHPDNPEYYREIHENEKSIFLAT